MRIHVKPHYQTVRELTLDKVDAMLANGELDGREQARFSESSEWTTLSLLLHAIRQTSPEFPATGPPPLHAEHESRSRSRVLSLAEAEKIVQEYGSVLAQAIPAGESAYCKSWLRHSPETIIQAMKLWLAYEVHQRSLTQDFRNEIGGAASKLPYFIEDTEARRLNALWGGTSDLRTPDEPFLAAKEAREFERSAGFLGLKLRDEMEHFIGLIECLDADDPLYYQRIYVLCGG